jgi:ribosomal protein S18 acetylase RimI-like enzyme
MTGAGALSILGIEERHRREEFDCGEDVLNGYLRRYARQNHERNIARTFVAVDAQDRVLGYYSLSSASIEFESLPAAHAKRIPKYPVPAVRIARLAVDRTMQGKRFGGTLLADALRRILTASSEVAVKVILVDAKNESAVAFYRHYGFMELKDATKTLFLPIETVIEAARS